MLCDKFKQLLNLPIKLCAYFEWKHNADGSLSVAFKNELGSVGNLIGEPRMWLTSSIPDGHLVLNGQTVSRTTYAELFAVYGTTYGAGDGSTTFNVPDLQGRFFFGQSASYPLGSTGGEVSHALTLTELPTDHEDWRIEGTGSGDLSGGDVIAGNIGTGPQSGTITTGPNGGGLAHNNMPPYFAGYYITRAKTT